MLPAWLRDPGLLRFVLDLPRVVLRHHMLTARGDLDPAGLQLLGHLAHEVDREQAILRPAPFTFTWSARLKVCLKARVAMPRCRNCLSSSGALWPVTTRAFSCWVSSISSGREAGHRHGDAVLVVGSLRCCRAASWSSARPWPSRRACRTADRSRLWSDRRGEVEGSHSHILH